MGISKSVFVGFLQVLQFPPLSQKHTSRCNGKENLPLVVNEGVNLCMDGALQWTGAPVRVYSCLTHSVHRIGSGFTATLISIKQLMNPSVWTATQHLNDKVTQTSVVLPTLISPTSTSNTQLKEFIQYCFIHIHILSWASGFPVNTKCIQNHTALHWHKKIPLLCSVPLKISLTSHLHWTFSVPENTSSGIKPTVWS